MAEAAAQAPAPAQLPISVHVEIASKEGCVWCDRAVALVNKWSAQIQHEAMTTMQLVKAPQDKAEYAEFVSSLKSRIAPQEHKTFPFVWVNGEFVGGHDALKKKLLDLALCDLGL